MKTALLGLVLVAVCLGLPDLTSATLAEDHCPQELVQTVDPDYLKVYLNSSCFWINVKDKKIYLEASTVCAQHNGTLAIPKTEALNDFLVAVLAWDALNYGSPLWIGMNDLIMEGAYLWDDGSPVEWTNFDKNNGGRGGDTEDCLALEPKTGTWHDFNCASRDLFFTSPKKAFICQFQKTE